jgi:hypothetical protein
LDKKMTIAALAVVVVAVIVFVGLSLRGGDRPAPPRLPTQDLSAVRTEAVETFASDLTATAAVASTDTPTEAETPTGTASVILSTETAGTPGTPATRSTAASIGSPQATTACLGLRFVRDVTIPDNTPMTPAQVFSKTWLVENSGTCPWQAGYQVVLIGGIAMGGSPYQLPQDVGPGGRIQVSIKMVAPTNQTGIVQGTWKMSDSSGTPFGDYMSVVIVVGSGTGGAPTLLPADTSTPTP